VQGVQYLRSLPYVDGKRIGIYGWSYGGYMTLMCADAGAGCVRGGRCRRARDRLVAVRHALHRALPIYSAGQSRRLPASNVLTLGDKLSRPLLLVHGMADDNVLFAHSTALMKKLQDLQKPFDLMTYPAASMG
jgi:dipeptidyl-peptidase-4